MLRPIGRLQAVQVSEMTIFTAWRARSAHFHISPKNTLIIIINICSDTYIQVQYNEEHYNFQATLLVLLLISLSSSRHHVIGNFLSLFGGKEIMSGKWNEIKYLRLFFVGKNTNSSTCFCRLGIFYGKVLILNGLVHYFVFEDYLKPSLTYYLIN